MRPLNIGFYQSWNWNVKSRASLVNNALLWLKLNRLTKNKHLKCIVEIKNKKKDEKTCVGSDVTECHLTLHIKYLKNTV